MPIRTPSAAKPKPAFSFARAATWAYFAALLALLGLGAFLWKSGDWLVRKTESGESVRWAVLLAGESRDMERSETAWTLFQEGRFDSLILSGPRVFKSRHESEFSAAYLESRGFPKDRLFQLPHEATSTHEEALILIPQARLLGIDTLLILTSDFHTARAERVFRKLAGGYPVVLVHPAVTPAFDPKAWWAGRRGKEIWLLEWLKTVHTAWELKGAKPLEGTAEFLLLEPNPRPTVAADTALGSKGGAAASKRSPAVSDTAARDTAASAKGGSADSASAPKDPPSADASKP